MLKIWRLYTETEYEGEEHIAFFAKKPKMAVIAEEFPSMTKKQLKKLHTTGVIKFDSVTEMILEKDVEGF